MQIETKTLTLNGTGYRVIASPSIEEDEYPCIEVYVAESMTRRAHWRRISAASTKNRIKAAARAAKANQC